VTIIISVNNVCVYVYIFTVGTESIQTPLNCSLIVMIVILQPFAKIIFSFIIVHTAPHIDRKTTELLTFLHIY